MCENCEDCIWETERYVLVAVISTYNKLIKEKYVLWVEYLVVIHNLYHIKQAS